MRYFQNRIRDIEHINKIVGQTLLVWSNRSSIKKLIMGISNTRLYLILHKSSRAFSSNYINDNWKHENGFNHFITWTNANTFSVYGSLARKCIRGSLYSSNDMMESMVAGFVLALFRFIVDTLWPFFSRISTIVYQHHAPCIAHESIQNVLLQLYFHKWCLYFLVLRFQNRCILILLAKNPLHKLSLKL